MVTDTREWRRGEFLVSTDRARLDVDVIHDFLTNSYWAKGISRELVARSLEHSLCFGIYDESGSKGPGFANAASPETAQAGFCRVVSDLATVAYLGDVFVLETYRGRGLSKFLMECATQHPALQGLRRWILLTRDAHAAIRIYAVEVGRALHGTASARRSTRSGKRHEKFRDVPSAV